MIPIPPVDEMEWIRRQARLQYEYKEDEADRVRRDGVQDSGRGSAGETDKGTVPEGQVQEEG